MTKDKTIKKPFYIQFLRPFAEVFALVTDVRNLLYNSGRLKSKAFRFPVISVGNLSVGGTGKSPMVAYLIALLQNDFQIGIVSRGYGRKTSKYISVQENSTADEVGDEPLMLRRKFPNVNVSVDTNRVHGIEKLIADSVTEKQTKNAVILDDAFQHRAVKAGLNILLTAYDDLFMEDFVLPAGRLRERRKNYRRAEIIVVTKCPKNLSVYERKTIIEKIHPLAYQSVYFSTVKYQDLMPVFAEKKSGFQNVLLITGIANGNPLEAFLKTKFANVFSHHFSDHHHFSIADLEKIRAQFNQIGAEKTVIVTTEKDAVRLLPFREWFEQNKIPLYFQPISTAFLNDDEKKFQTEILQFLNSFAPELHFK